MRALLILSLAAAASSTDWFTSTSLNGALSPLCMPNGSADVCECVFARVECPARGLTDLDPRLLPDLVTVVDFSRNGIEVVGAVGEGTAWPSNIREIDLSRNLISSVSAASFSGLSYLEALDLSRNLLTSLPSGVFSSLSHLTALDLSHNRLGQVSVVAWLGSAGAYSALPGIRIDLSYNGNTSLSTFSLTETSFSSLRSLTFLDLTNCSLSEMPLTVFENTSIAELRLASNPLRQVPTTQLYSLRSTLESLDLSETDFTVINPSAFHGLFFLRTLKLNNLAMLEKIEPQAFHSLQHLTLFECQNNKNLYYLDAFAFFDNFHMEYPNTVRRALLSNNGLQSLSSATLRWSASEAVHVEGNPWHCGCDLAWMADEPNVVQSEFLVCASPDRLKGFPIKELRARDFECNSKLTAYDDL